MSEVSVAFVFSIDLYEYGGNRLLWYRHAPKCAVGCWATVPLTPKL